MTARALLALIALAALILALSMPKSAWDALPWPAGFYEEPPLYERSAP